MKTDKEIELEAREIMSEWRANGLYAGMGAALICLKQGKVSEAHEWIRNTYDPCDIAIDDNLTPEQFYDFLTKGEPESLSDIVDKIKSEEQ